MPNIILKPIERETGWAGVTRFARTQDSIAPYFNANGSGVVNGLSKEDQKRLEEEMKMTLGELAPGSKYWTEYRIVMTDRAIEIDTETPKGELDYLFLKAHKRVANSVNELQDWPLADYVIYDLEQDAKKENVKTKVVKNAYLKFSKMTTTEMKDVLSLMGKRVNDVSSEFLENELSKVIQDSPADFLAIVEDKHLKTRVFIEDLVRVKALRKVGSHYIFGDDPIGHDMESTIIYLEDPKNQGVKMTLTNKLTSLKKEKTNV
jgi:hypothetical protein